MGASILVHAFALGNQVLLCEARPGQSWLIALMPKREIEGITNKVACYAHLPV